jgi:hypothetical protein
MRPIIAKSCSQTIGWFTQQRPANTGADFDLGAGSNLIQPSLSAVNARG